MNLWSIQSCAESALCTSCLSCCDQGTFAPTSKLSDLRITNRATSRCTKWPFHARRDPQTCTTLAVASPVDQTLAFPRSKTGLGASSSASTHPKSGPRTRVCHPVYLPTRLPTEQLTPASTIAHTSPLAGATPVDSLIVLNTHIPAQHTPSRQPAQGHPETKVRLLALLQPEPQ